MSVEKPLALRASGAEGLVDIAESRSQVVMVRRLLRDHPGHIEAEGAVGCLRS